MTRDTNVHRKLVLLCRRGVAEALQVLSRPFVSSAICVNSEEGLLAAPIDDAILIVFSTGVIVPEDVLERVSAAYNFHPGSPSYPGRDPHYWARRDSAQMYGCTAHVMEKLVDSGDIIEALLFEVRVGDTAEYLRAKAEIVGLRLFEKLLPIFLNGEVRPTGPAWSGIKRSRADFFAQKMKFETNQEIDLSGLEPYDLANALYFGIWVQKDKRKAQEYYVKARATGSKNAGEKLDFLFTCSVPPP